MNKSICYAWFDMETTGLDANKDVPLELGIILTDELGNEIASNKWLVIESNETYGEGIRRGSSNPFVNKMHSDSGLWDDLADIKDFSRDQADEAAVAWMESVGVRGQSRGEGDDFDGLGMAGNSIGSLDRPFVLVHFPKLNAFLGYRNIDLSSLKEICKRNHPALYQNLKPIIGTKSDAKHRVLDDCRASIREFQTYLDEFLILPED